MLQLGKQFHHRPHHAADGAEHRLRRLHLLRRLLLSQLRLDLVLCPRDQGQVARADGSRLQRRRLRGGDGEDGQDREGDCEQERVGGGVSNAHHPSMESRGSTIWQCNVL